METQAAPQNKRTWLIVFGALVASIFIYGLLCVILTQARTLHPVKPPEAGMSLGFHVVAVVALIAAIGWMHVTLGGKIGGTSIYGESQSLLMQPSAFQSNSIVALAIAESCTIFGLTLFFMGATIKDFLPFAVGTLLVDLFFILPRGLKYWASWERQQNATPQESNRSLQWR